MCFLCLWNSCDDINHYKLKVWPLRTENTVGRYNVAGLRAPLAGIMWQHEPLVDPVKALLPPCYINWDSFICCSNEYHNGGAFHYLNEEFGELKTEVKFMRFDWS